MKLIDKAALVAEIEKLKYNLCPDFYEYNYDAAKVELLEKIENFIDTLEAKVVDELKEVDIEDAVHGTVVYRMRLSKYLSQL